MGGWDGQIIKLIIRPIAIFENLVMRQGIALVLHQVTFARRRDMYPDYYGKKT